MDPSSWLADTFIGRAIGWFWRKVRDAALARAFREEPFARVTPYPKLTAWMTDDLIAVGFVVDTAKLERPFILAGAELRTPITTALVVDVAQVLVESATGRTTLVFSGDRLFRLRFPAQLVAGARLRRTGEVIAPGSSVVGQLFFRIGAVPDLPFDVVLVLQGHDGRQALLESVVERDTRRQVTL